MKATIKITSVLTILAILGAVFATSAQAARRGTPPDTSGSTVKPVVSLP